MNFKNLSKENFYYLIYLIGVICFFLLWIIIGILLLKTKYQLFGFIGGSIGELILAGFALYLIFIFITSTSDNNKSGLVIVYPYEYGALLFLGYLLFSVKGKPLLALPGISWVEKGPANIETLIDSYQVMTADYESAKSDDIPKSIYRDHALTHRATQPFTVGLRYIIEDSSHFSLLIKKAKNYTQARQQLSYLVHRVVSDEVGRRLPQQINDYRDKVNKYLRENLEKFLQINNSHYWIGLKVVEIGFLNPILTEPINIGLLQIIEEQLRRAKRVIDERAQREIEILEAEAAAKKISLTGLAEADVIKAKQIAEQYGYIELSKRLGIPAGLIQVILEGLADVTQKMDLKTVLFSGASQDGKEGGLMNELMKFLIAIKSIGDDWLKQTGEETKINKK